MPCQAQNAFPVHHWDQETFQVVDAGEGKAERRLEDTLGLGEILPCACETLARAGHGSIVDASPNSTETLNKHWVGEVFRVVDAGYGMFGLHSRGHGKYVRMHETGMDASGRADSIALPSGWWKEAFVAYPIDPLQDTLALWQPDFKRCIEMTSEGDVIRGDEVDGEDQSQWKI
ncbi:unnamed protein product [Symbiodinium sp. CCMP2592]|nr:unnamed protein product [Symbiodinium sp. CCMP2592]